MCARLSLRRIVALTSMWRIAPSIENYAPCRCSFELSARRFRCVSRTPNSPISQLHAKNNIGQTEQDTDRGVRPHHSHDARRCSRPVRFRRLMRARGAVGDGPAARAGQPQPMRLPARPCPAPQRRCSPRGVRQRRVIVSLNPRVGAARASLDFDACRTQGQACMAAAAG